MADSPSRKIQLKQSGILLTGMRDCLEADSVTRDAFEALAAQRERERERERERASFTQHQ